MSINDVNINKAGFTKIFAIYMNELRSTLNLVAEHPSKHGVISMNTVYVDDGFRYTKIWAKQSNLYDRFLSARHLYKFGIKTLKAHKFNDAKKVLKQAVSALPEIKINSNK